MGGDNSKNRDDEDIPNLFNTEEKEKIQSLYSKITDNSQLGFLSHLQRHLSSTLSDEIIKRVYLCAVKFSKTKQEAFTLGGLATFLSNLFKGSLTDKTEIILSLASSTDGINGQGLVKFASQLISSYIKAIHHSDQFRSWQFCPQEGWVNNLAVCLLTELFQKDSPNQDGAISIPPADRIFPVDQIETWVSRCPLFLHILDLVFHSCFRIDQSEEFARRVMTPIIPAVNKVNWSKTKTVLDAASVMLLNHSLPRALQTEWRPLYSNTQHGDSFSQLQTRIIKQGPTLMVVRDKEGHVFGGFASDAWDIRPQFVGNATCFLFSLAPQFNVYTTTGYNDHYMYLNHGVQTMPNGLGMGGQLEYFGLWIDQSFNIGHSKAGPRCTTYGSPQLSKSADFEVDVIEVWGVGPEPKEEEGSVEEASILDKDPEAKAMLSLIGKGPVSEGLREGDTTADSPEDHELPPLSM